MEEALDGLGSVGVCVKRCESYFYLLYRFIIKILIGVVAADLDVSVPRHC